jgi:UDP-GlcNAc:undecaprenyl-phosphate GlcNAc-1-phosphate transferase
MDFYTAAMLIGGATVLPGLLSLVLCYWVRIIAPRWGLMDRPGGRKIHTQPTPLGGGLAVWASMMLFFVGLVCGLLVMQAVPAWRALLPPLVNEHWQGLKSRVPDLAVVLLGSTLLMLLGLWDDRRGLPWTWRLAAQFLIAAALVFSQGDDWRLTAFVAWRPVTYSLSILWIVALVNAFNMLDNMDGLSAGVATIVALLLAAFLLCPPATVTEGPQLFVGGFLLVLSGSLLGFLWHNRPPARLFLGDAGSYFIGFCLAVATLVATYASYESSQRHAVLAPVCLMAVPLYDMVTVVLIRLRQGRSPFEGDRNHFSHRLVALGFSRWGAVLTIYLTSATCGLAAIVLPRMDWPGAICVVLMVLCVLWLIWLLEYTATKHQNKS